MSGSPHPLAGRRILVVEDEYLIAMDLKRWLRGAGVEVIGPVPSVDQALDLIEEEGNALDAAVLDINLGGGEVVYPAADRLSALGVPYLFATGDVRVHDDPAYRDRPRLEKPILDPELLRALERLIRTS
jgi:CheY-like chemotaxis protein